MRNAGEEKLAVVVAFLLTILCIGPVGVGVELDRCAAHYDQRRSKSIWREASEEITLLFQHIGN